MSRAFLFVVALGWGISAIIAGAASERDVVPGMGPTSAPAAFQVGAPAAAPSDASALIAKYCVTCHNQRTRTAGLALDTLSADRVGEHPEIWEKAVRKLRSGAMPPPVAPRPDAATIERLVSTLETSLDRAAAASPNPSRPAVHRLNRTEYANAVRDILGVEIDAREILPADDPNEQGFDNIAEVLSMSPALVERYLSAARRVSRIALGLPPAGPAGETYRLPQKLTQDDRMSDDLPFGSRGGLSVRHTFPVDGEYDLQVRLDRNLYGVIKGLGDSHRIEIRLDGALVKAETIGGEATGDMPPMSWAGTIPASPEWEAYVRGADAALSIRLPIKAGARDIGVSFVDKFWIAEGVPQPPILSLGFGGDEAFDGKPAVESLIVTGPYGTLAPGDTESRKKILACRPTTSRAADEERCARTILSTIARRAYRRPVIDADIRPLLQSYRSRPELSFDERLQLALQMVFVDPDFLFRVERTPRGLAPGQMHRLDDLSLASRLSFFLWSSVPDDALLDAAVAGRLSNPAVLEAQVRRMLADDRAQALVDNFASQWLAFGNMRNITPDQDLFMHFDENLREAFLEETQRFIGSQLREDRSVVELLSADYTYLNERLARHYGVPGIYGSHFRKVTLPPGTRGGLLGHGSLLTVTSYPNRTSPVLRGKWLLENILGTPPPDPPPDVPSLGETGEGGVPASVRQRLEAHRRNPVCASCHSVIDPLGFALENFDAVGTFRVNDAGTKIDASGTLPGAVPFSGLAGLRELLVGPRRAQFVGTFTERLLTYALGRNLEPQDFPVVRQIARDAARDDARWSAIILGIVRSMPFQMRRAES